MFIQRRLFAVGRQVQQPAGAFVGELDAPRFVQHDQALRHVLDDDLQAVLLFQLAHLGKDLVALGTDFAHKGAQLGIDSVVLRGQIRAVAGERVDGFEYFPCQNDGEQHGKSGQDGQRKRELPHDRTRRGQKRSALH